MNENIFDKNLDPGSMREEERSLGRLAVKGGMWVFALKTAQRTLGLVRTIILARMLSPSDFGLMGIAVLAINTLEMFSKTGVEQSLVQKKGDIAKRLDTAWTIQVARAFLLFGILFIGAPGIGKFFNSAGAAAVIRALALIEIFTAVKNIGVIYFEKDLHFSKRFIYEFSGLFSNIVVSITLAFLLRSVWALVYGSLAGGLTTCIVSYFMHPYRPKVEWDANVASEFIRFGKWIFISSILFFAVSQGDSAFIGKVLGLSALGLYQMAQRFSQLLSTEVRSVVFYVLFPVYSKIQGEAERLCKAYLDVMHIVSFLAIPFFTGIFLVAHDFTRLFLGEKWMPMVSVMQILALAGFFSSVASTANVIFYSIGKPKVETIWHGARLVVLAALIYPMSMRWNIAGTSTAVCAGTLVWMLGFLTRLKKEIHFTWSALGYTALYPALNTAAVAVVFLFVRRMTGMPNVTGLLFIITISAAVYFAGIAACSRVTDYKVFDIVREKMR